MRTSSPEETEALAARLAPLLRAGDVVTLAGDLGAGKTTFVRGACAALGVREAVTSPTFTVGHRYHGSRDVSHLDLYRFEAVTDADWGALEPYFEDAVAFVEWPAVAAAWLPPPRVEVRLRHTSDGGREVTAASAESALLDAMFATW